MRLAFWPGPHGDWPALLEICRHVEATGWDRIYFADHFMPNAADTSTPTQEAWTTLAALAATVPRIGLGTLVSGNTYRHPAVLAKAAVNVDQISGGRVVLGIGSGWQENEHTAYGIPFYTTGERLERMDEACNVIRQLLERSRSDFSGRFHQLVDAPLEPKPVKGRLPLLIGGGGEQRTLRSVARWADEWNIWGTPEKLAAKMAVLDQRCEEVGRDPAEIERSAVALLFLVDDEASARKLREAGPDRPMIIGNDEQVIETLHAYRAAGVHELVVPDFNLGQGGRRRDVLDRLMERIAPALRDNP
jgi:F420-dependent oxidoreductase-like protein